MKTFVLFIVSALSVYAMDALVSTEWVDTHLKDKHLVIVDVSDTECYREAGHLPGAVSTSIGQWRMPKEKHLVVRPSEVIASHMRSLGINNDSDIILYAHIDTPKDFLKASYVYWAMKYHGLENVAIMDGGFDKWLTEKRATTAEAAEPKQGTFTASMQPERFADEAYVREHIGRLPMLDARPTEFYFGLKPSPGVARAGHIAKATSYPWNYSVNGDYTVKAEEELEAIFTEGLALKRDQEMVVYCTGGLETSFNYFILEGFLGYKKVRLYDASMKEWGNRSDTPMVRYRWE